MGQLFPDRFFATFNGYLNRQLLPYIPIYGQKPTPEDEAYERQWRRLRHVALSGRPSVPATVSKPSRATPIYTRPSPEAPTSPGAADVDTQLLLPEPEDLPYESEEEEKEEEEAVEEAGASAVNTQLQLPEPQHLPYEDEEEAGTSPVDTQLQLLESGDLSYDEEEQDNDDNDDAVGSPERPVDTRPPARATRGSPPRELKPLLSLLQRSERIVFFIGAGASVSCGIPDFRSAGGLFKQVTRAGLKLSGLDLFNINLYRNRDTIGLFHDMVLRLREQAGRASPSPFHELIASVARRGRLLRLYTQNVDDMESRLEGLTTRAPLLRPPWPLAIQMHGSLSKMECSACSDVQPFDPGLFGGDTPVDCGSCRSRVNRRVEQGKRAQTVGYMVPRMTLYGGKTYDEDAIAGALNSDMRADPDALIVAGTSLRVPAASSAVRRLFAAVRRSGGKVAWVNTEKDAPNFLPLGEPWDIAVRCRCDDVAEAYEAYAAAAQG